jgi:ATP synthase protein I
LTPKIKSFAKYSSLGIQMAAIIIAFGFLGDYLDRYFNSKNAYWTAGLLVLGVSVSLYVVLKSALKNE